MLLCENLSFYAEKFSFPLTFMEFSLLNKCCGGYFLVPCCSATKYLSIFWLFQRGGVSSVVHLVLHMI